MTQYPTLSTHVHILLMHRIEIISRNALSIFKYHVNGVSRTRAIAEVGNIAT